MIPDNFREVDQTQVRNDLRKYFIENPIAITVLAKQIGISVTTTKRFMYHGYSVNVTQIFKVMNFLKRHSGSDVAAIDL